jgi:type II secretory pathway pseudopilin PulG
MFRQNRLSLEIKLGAMRGDTIVEVLMSIVIVGAVIAGAYALASRSLAEGVSASEHSQAIKLAEAQVEALKSRQKDAGGDPTLWNSTYNVLGSPIPPNRNNFCIDTTVTLTSDPNWGPIKNGNSSFNGNNLTAGAGANEYNAACVNKGGTSDDKYFVNIKLNPTSNLPTYLVTVKWVPAGNSPTSQTQIYYRF